jgi:hypothetical protein
MIWLLCDARGTINMYNGTHQNCPCQSRLFLQSLSSFSPLKHKLLHVTFFTKFIQIINYISINKNNNKKKNTSMIIHSTILILWVCYCYYSHYYYFYFIYSPRNGHMCPITSRWDMLTCILFEPTFKEDWSYLYLQCEALRWLGFRLASRSGLILSISLLILSLPLSFLTSGPAQLSSSVRTHHRWMFSKQPAHIKLC